MINPTRISMSRTLRSAPICKPTLSSLRIVQATSSNFTAPNRTLAREAHTYARQSRGLYNGTHLQFGSSISDSHRKSPRTWLPNVHSHSLYSKSLQKTIKLRITANVWRTIQSKYAGELDAFLTCDSKQLQKNLGTRGETLRDQIIAAQKKRARAVGLGRTKNGRVVKATQENVGVTKQEEEKAKLEGLATGM